MAIARRVPAVDPGYARARCISERLAAIEAQLKTLSDQAGVSYDEPVAELPEAMEAVGRI